MTKQFITANDYFEVVQLVRTTENGIESLLSNFGTVINSFNNQSIVDSFYKSGNFGASNKEELEKLATGMREYINILSGDSGLIAETINYCNNKAATLNNETMEKVSSGGEDGLYISGDKNDSSFNIDPRLSYKSSVEQHGGRVMGETYKSSGGNVQIDFVSDPSDYMANQVVSNENNLGYNDSLTKNENKKGD
jgi:hypothetical protein